MRKLKLEEVQEILHQIIIVHRVQTNKKLQGRTMLGEDLSGNTYFSIVYQKSIDILFVCNMPKLVLQ